MPRELSLAEIFQLGYYWETKILLTAVRLDVFSALGEKELNAGEVARLVGADERALALLLNALVAMRILSKAGERYANSRTARTYLTNNSPDYVGHLLLLHEAEWNAWGQLDEAIRTGCSPTTEHVFRTNPELGAKVLAVLDRIGQHSGPVLAKRLELDRAETLLDVGGGAGTNAVAFCRVYPRLRATVFDLPTTLPMAERVVKEAGLDGRVTLQAGDFNRDSLGGVYDVILMSDVLHYQDDAANAALVAKCFGHLRQGGRLVIKDRFLTDEGTSPAWVAAFAVHIFVNTQRGRCYRVSEALTWLRRAGFTSVSEVEQTAVVQGFKAA